MAVNVTAFVNGADVTVPSEVLPEPFLRKNSTFDITLSLTTAVARRNVWEPCGIVALLAGEVMAILRTAEIVTVTGPDTRLLFDAALLSVASAVIV